MPSGLFYQCDQADQLKFLYIFQTPIKPVILPRYDLNFGPINRAYPCYEVLLQVLWLFEIYQYLSLSA